MADTLRERIDNLNPWKDSTYAPYYKQIERYRKELFNLILEEIDGCLLSDEEKK